MKISVTWLKLKDCFSLGLLAMFDEILDVHHISNATPWVSTFLLIWITTLNVFLLFWYSFHMKSNKKEHGLLWHLVFKNICKKIWDTVSITAWNTGLYRDTISITEWNTGLYRDTVSIEYRTLQGNCIYRIQDSTGILYLWNTGLYRDTVSIEYRTLQGYCIYGIQDSTGILYL